MGTRLSGAEREMARKLGVTPQQRGDMLATVSAVLARDASAVAAARAGLAKLRNAAAAELAFERAQKLHQELAALEWICAVQRATVTDGEDLVFYGWSDETLVRFEIVAGRLCDWQVRACGSDAASEKVCLTPSHWAAFAQRNAVFAAALRSA